MRTPRARADHYAPPASDLASAPLEQEAASIQRFELGEPFLPLVQLTAVLPPLSAAALPAPLATMMRAADSPLASAFPSELRLDLNGASAAWKAVVLLPFLDAAALHAAFAQAKDRLTAEEAARNRFGPTCVCTPRRAAPPARGRPRARSRVRPPAPSSHAGIPHPPSQVRVCPCERHALR